MAVEIESNPEIDYRVTLRNSMSVSEYVKFVATPDLIETRNVNYKTIDPVHAPGQIAAYQNTSSRTFNLSSIKLVSRTSAEAALNLKKLWLLRSWTMPQFGKSTVNSAQRTSRENFARTMHWLQGVDVSQSDMNHIVDFYRGKVGAETRGMPPPVLLLSAYSKDSSQGRTSTNRIAEHINRVPVVIQNLSIPYPADVSYIPAEGTNVPMPTIMTLDMTLMETHSANEYETFDLNSFKNGILPGF